MDQWIRICKSQLIVLLQIRSMVMVKLRLGGYLLDLAMSPNVTLPLFMRLQACQHVKGLWHKEFL